MRTQAQKIAAILEAYQALEKAAYEASRQRGIDRKLHEGGKLGPAPLGYINCRQGEKTWVEIDRMKSLLVKKAFELATNRDYSLPKIAIMLAAAGLTTRHNCPISAPRLRELLTNPFYTGVVRYDGREMSGNHPPIITTELFAQVQQRFTRKTKDYSGSALCRPCVAV